MRYEIPRDRPQKESLIYEYNKKESYWAEVYRTTGDSGGHNHISPLVPGTVSEGLKLTADLRP